MSALRKAKAASGCLLVSLSLASGIAYSQQGESRGSGEIPDLQGVYSIATVTMLERGEQFGGELVISAEQAAAVGETGASYLDDLVSNVGGAEAQVGGYNTFWMDPGERMAVIDGGIRTSIIVEPEDGRLPWAEGAQRRIFGSMRAQSAFDGPEVRPMGERCLVGFGSSGGPPMLPVLYNNHSQIVQTDDYVMILAEMNHDARMRPGKAPTGFAGRKEKGPHAHGHADTHGGNRCLNGAHGVVNGHAIVHRTARTVNIEHDLFCWIFGVERQQAHHYGLG